MTAIEVEKIEAEVTFLSKAGGCGREIIPILNGNWYRPHVVIGDPNQRKVVLKSHTYEIENPDGSKSQHTTDNWSDEEYIGVMFDAGPVSFNFGMPIRVKLTLAFWPAPQYEKLQPDVTFTVREGSNVIGYGRVLSDRFAEPMDKTPRPEVWPPAV